MQQTKRKTKKTTPKARIVTTGNTVRIEAPKSRGRQQPKQKIAVFITPDEVFGGFIGFLREHAIIGLAVGFAIATQVQLILKQLITSFIQPFFALIFNNDLTKETFTWHFHANHADFGWGAFLYMLLNFIFVLAAIYGIIKIFHLDSLDKPKSSK